MFYITKNVGKLPSSLKNARITLISKTDRMNNETADISHNRI